MSSSILYSKQTNLGTVLIENDSCLGNSLSTLQQNFEKIEENFISLTSKVSGFQNIIDTFNVYNSSLSYINTYLKDLSGFWINTQKFVLDNYKSWEATPFSLVYTKTIDLSSWYSDISYKNQQIPAWLEVNFPSGRFPSAQTVDIFVFLNAESSSSFEYYNSYQEKCSTQTIIQPISCTNCQVVPPDSFSGGPSSCASELKILSNIQPCEGSGGRQLSLGLSRQDIKDSGIRRVEKVTYRKSVPADGVGLNRWHPS
jgi:hypothetical protein